MQAYFARIDDLLAHEQMPPEYADFRAHIYCSDCERKSETKFHFVYHKVYSIHIYIYIHAQIDDAYVCIVNLCMTRLCEIYISFWTKNIETNRFLCNWNHHYAHDKMEYDENMEYNHAEYE
jgi:hypothetical protein